jgi:hypothetical protein
VRFLNFLQFLISFVFVFVLFGFLTIITLQLAIIIGQSQPKAVEQQAPQTQQQGDEELPRFDQLSPFPV